MDEKRPAPRAMSPPRSLRRSRPTLTIAFVIAVVYTFWIWQPFNPILDQTMVAITNNDVHTADKLVPLEAHIMSKCPDAKVNAYPSMCKITNAQYLQDGLELLVLPVMQRVHDKVNFTLSYIGRPTANDGVDCMHGPSECMGNIIELCARELYPDPKINLGFIMCLSRDYSEIPERSLVEDCALESAIDFQQLNDCAVREDGAYGLSLLRDSIKRTADVYHTRL
ncbi:uncharacterized protein FFUJ_04691 [Fusarium fujikuroi IMI 58289]|uniref:Gamma interferon inducible lysosomal thiol reductase n=1 Tax=Gibberella fujikuroi (strain CBS 195.34 / IMI 58289 / NRRL A-6831) TaxID=1279085 RepID=S0DNX6_GIBF5|nr:uncharacterized protein FFUJ_04691 [Fusarium fujikuroi IMI 58289]KLP03149.1 uncharacterized protein Y057_3255 [Fusarium fujikuroi]KLP18442.1 uncharacterized protein LW94_10786 [Fusarium fujikuroi]QGI60420.1 hypothetical protein CEK27_004391 [Fusarium fujikuroi]QGI77620.1 hypothetical protein CEK25_004349 [Fusarium fujikuroi]QGI91326.1 hypothetical protein CEK26_004395 [Fusarium fujikuroi]